MESAIDTLKLDISNITNLPEMNQFNIDYSSNGLTGKIGSNVFIVFLLIFVIAIYLTLFVSSSSSTMSQAPVSSTTSFETILLILFIGLLALNMLKYFFNIDVKASLINLFSKEPELDIEINKLGKSLIPGDIIPSGDEPQTEFGDEVFHISDNIYTYEDAKGICGAFGGRLANYFDIEKAYKSGGEWCGYGWSDDQMVFYPTQKATYERLKKEGRKNDCGRPGINGGYIGNPNARFGVNCVGKKPKITPEEQELMYETRNAPQTMKEINEKKEIEYWKQYKDNINISPFNMNRWNM